MDAKMEYIKGEWLKITDFLPDVNTQVLVYGMSKQQHVYKVQPAKLCNNWKYRPNPFEPEFIWEGYDIIDHDGETDEVIHVTHWMPLPAKPKP
jgi:hypothetical protein